MKIILILISFLILSLSFNYALYNRAGKYELIVAAQDASAKEFKAKSEEKEKRIKTLDTSYQKVLKDMEENEESFSELESKLNKIKCNKPSVVISNAKSKPSLIDPDVVEYYNIMHSAYNLQNKH